MAETTGISWTNSTWNPVRGCERVSEGCRNCYAEILAARHSYAGGWGHGLAKWATRPDGTKEARWTGELREVQKALDAPLKWRTPRRIFVNSMSDLYHEDVPDAYIDRVAAVAALTSQHTYQCLTKRASRMLAYWSNPEREAWIAKAALDMLGPRAAIGLKLPLPNWWHGVSAEDQQTFDERVELLGQVPAAIRWVSAEPMLDYIDVGNAFDDPPDEPSKYGKLHWIVIGLESGQNRRERDIDIARSLIGQCQYARVPVFVKQDNGPRPGMQGRFTDEEWALKEYPA